MVLTRATISARRRWHSRHRRRHPRGDQHHDAVRRSEPDLHARIPRTRCSCATTSIGVDGQLHSTGSLLEPAPTATAAWRPGPTSRPMRSSSASCSTDDGRRTTCRCSPPTPTAISSPARHRPRPDRHRMAPTALPARPTTFWSSATRPLPITTAGAVRTGHAFLNDIAHGARAELITTPPAHIVVADTDRIAGGSRRPRRASTTTNCSTRTTSPATAASTRTSA